MGTAGKAKKCALADFWKGSHVQVLIRWSLQQGFIPLPKSSNAQRQKSNLEVFSFELSQQDMQAMPCSEPCSFTCNLTSCLTSGWCLVPWEAPV